ncbi:hypothetical protein [Streptomyces gardneri]|uniref:hypothetical protein n=1 Tax=Streptomyces gardneri TaxID=66892 RepID=UPI0037CD4257
MALGVYGDAHGWWDDRSFLTNLASSFASLLFGVPLALLVLSHLSAMQAETSERRAVTRRVQSATADFASAFQDTLPSTTLAETRGILASLVPVAERAVRNFPGGRGGLQQDPDAVRACEEDCRVLIAGVSDVFPPAEWNAQLSRLWEVLDEEVRPSAVAAGISWMPFSDIRMMDSAIRDAALRPSTPERLQEVLLMFLAAVGRPRTAEVKRAENLLQNELRHLHNVLSGMQTIADMIDGRRLPSGF